MSDRLAELADRAQKQQDENNLRAIKEAQAAMLPESHPDFDGKHCVECDRDMPKARLDLGRVRCVLCQDAKERGSKLRRR